jgi:hypothetical protein
VADFDPLHERFPWPHHDPGRCITFRLRANPSDKEIGSVFAALAQMRGLARIHPPARLLELLAHEYRVSNRPFDIPGGIVAIVDGRIATYHGCCTTIADWREWLRLLETGRPPHNGHDPFSTAMVVADRVEFYRNSDDAAPMGGIARVDYRRSLGELEQDLREFLRNAEGWIGSRVSTKLREALTRGLAASLGVPVG